MSDISIQFHALPEELIPLLEQWVADYALHVVALQSKPFIAFETQQGALREVFDSGVVRLAFTLVAPDLSAKTSNEFADKNTNKMLVEVGRLSSSGLGESWLTSRATDKAASSTWQKIARKLRAVTKQGVRAINPKTGESALLKHHRYTGGAKALDEQGVVILPAAGTSVLKLGLSAQEPERTHEPTNGIGRGNPFGK